MSALFSCPHSAWHVLQLVTGGAGEPSGSPVLSTVRQSRVARPLDAIGSYLRLRDWSFAVIDLMEVAGRSMSGRDRVEIGDQTLMETSALLRSLLQQIDTQVEVMKEV